MRRGPSVTPVFLRRCRSSLLNSTGTNGSAQVCNPKLRCRAEVGIGSMQCATTTALVTCLLVWGAETACALDCPVPQPKTTASALQESPQTIEELSALLAAQGTGVVSEIVTQVKRQYPTAQDAEIVNYLVTLYCPVVNQDAALSDAEKADRLSAFSSRVMQTLASR